MTDQRGQRYTLALHGKLAGEWVNELERYWSSIVRSVPTAKVVVALEDVSFIDADGERLVERMWRQGTEFVGRGCMTRYVLEKVLGQPAGQVPPDGSGGAAPDGRHRH